MFLIPTILFYAAIIKILFGNVKFRFISASYIFLCCSYFIVPSFIEPAAERLIPRVFRCYITEKIGLYNFNCQAMKYRPNPGAIVPN